MKAEHQWRGGLRWLSQRQRAWRVPALAIISAAGCLTYWFVSRRSNTANPGQSAKVHNSAPNLAANSSPNSTPESNRSKQPGAGRAVYAYSIVPGGIASVAELRAAMVKDSVVFGQYSTFHLERARIIRLDHERRAHVSYRVGNRVYWTKRELKLEKGETLITDGIETARTKCGNLISESPEAPVSPNEPAEQALNTPIDPAQASGELESDNRFPGLEPPPSVNPAPRSYDPPQSANPWSGDAPAPGGPGIVFIPPPFTIEFPSGSPPPNPPHQPPTVPAVINTAEPGTAAQFLLALPAILFLRRRTKAKPA
jgi:hypothetical protein